MLSIKYVSLKSFFFLLVAVAGLQVGYAQSAEKSEKEDKAAVVQRLLTSKNFVFRAQTVHPTGGRFFPLTTEYTVNVSGDTVRTDLPYFGRAFMAQTYPGGGGINFTSTNFNYQVKERRKGGWEITIQPKDGTDVRQMFLSVFEDGNASLRVNSNNRQPISYNGYIMERNRGRRG